MSEARRIPTIKEYVEHIAQLQKQHGLEPIRPEATRRLIEWATFGMKHWIQENPDGSYSHHFHHDPYYFAALVASNRSQPSRAEYLAVGCGQEPPSHRAIMTLVDECSLSGPSQPSHPTVQTSHGLDASLLQGISGTLGQGYSRSRTYESSNISVLMRLIENRASLYPSRQLFAQKILEILKNDPALSK